jgi:hypothetical protein
LVRDDKVRLYWEPNEGKIESHFKWHRTAGRLLGLPPTDYFDANYIGHIITWRRENVLKMYEHIETVSRRGWLETLCSEWNIAEYILYGVFVNRILGDESGHYYDAQDICLPNWGRNPMSDEQIQGFLNKIRPEHVAIMISSKARMPVHRYEPLLETIPVK